MFPVRAMKVLSFFGVNSKMQQKCYSRLSYFSFKFLTHDFRKNGNSFLLNKFRPSLKDSKASSRFKENSSKILRTWSKQCEFVVAYKIRRTQQLISLYRKLWDDFRLKLFFQRCNANLWKHRKYAYMCCVAPAFNWDKERIPDEEFDKLDDDINKVRILYEKHKDLHEVDMQELEKKRLERALLNKDQPKVGCPCARCRNLKDEEDWTPFYTNSEIKIWRKEHVDYRGEGLYVYKVYGQYYDVTARDFFQVQIDTAYRKEWDPNCIKLDIIESDEESSSDILYWEFLFPKMFYNRDYVCNRRYKINHGQKSVTIVSESIQHPLCPEKPPVHRVREYWSHTVIRATDNFDKPGMEFTITYFDNPELSIPSYISTWYTINGMPEYLEQQRKAALELQSRRRKERLKRKQEERKDDPQNKPAQKAPEKRILIL